MKRLREMTSGDDPRVDRAKVLLRELAPLEMPSRAARERALAQILVERRKMRWSPALLLRPAVAIGVVLALVAAAGATVGRAPAKRIFAKLGARFGGTAEKPIANVHAKDLDRPGLRSAPPSSIVAPSISIKSALAEPDRDLPPTNSIANSIANPSADSIANPSANSIANLNSRSNPRRVATPSSPPSQSVTASSSAIVAEEGSLVQDAISALETDHAPARAAALADEYLRRYPHGALAEEAFMISLKAARLSDPPRAARLAAEYLRRFPHGLYRAAAAHVASSSSQRIAEPDEP